MYEKSLTQSPASTAQEAKRGILLRTGAYRGDGSGFNSIEFQKEEATSTSNTLKTGKLVTLPHYPKAKPYQEKLFRNIYFQLEADPEKIYSYLTEKKAIKELKKSKHNQNIN